jgi:hypothetical protein
MSDGAALLASHFDSILDRPVPDNSPINPGKTRDLSQSPSVGRRDAHYSRRKENQKEKQY